jgi:hypothetical protein
MTLILHGDLSGQQLLYYLQDTISTFSSQPLEKHKLRNCNYYQERKHSVVVSNIFLILSTKFILLIGKNGPADHLWPILIDQANVLVF